MADARRLSGPLRRRRRQWAEAERAAALRRAPGDSESEHGSCQTYHAKRLSNVHRQETGIRMMAATPVTRTSAAANVMPLLILTALLMHEWLPAMMAAEVVERTTRLLEDGNQEIPSISTPAATDEQLQRIPHTSSSGSVPTAQLGHVTALPKKRRRGPPPRIRLIKVYKKVWRNRKRPRKPPATTGTPDTMHRRQLEYHKKENFDSVNETKLNEEGVNTKKENSQNDKSPNFTETLSQQFNFSSSRNLQSEHKSDSNGIEGYSSIENKTVDFETKNDKKDNLQTDDTKEAKQSDENISPRFLDEENWDEVKNNKQNKGVYSEAHTTSIPYLNKNINNSAKGVISEDNTESNLSTLNPESMAKTTHLSWVTRKKKKNDKSKNRSPIIFRTETTNMPIITLDDGKILRDKKTEVNYHTTPRGDSMRNINDPSWFHILNVDHVTNQPKTSARESYEQNVWSLLTQTEQFSERNTFLHDDDQSKQILDMRNDYQKTSDIPHEEQKEKLPQSISSTEKSGNSGFLTVSNTKGIEQKTEKSLQIQSQQPPPLFKQSVEGLEVSTHILPTTFSSNLIKDVLIQDSHLPRSGGVVGGIFKEKHSIHPHNEVLKKYILLKPSEKPSSDGAFESQDIDTDITDQSNRNLGNTQELHHDANLCNVPNLSEVMPLNLCNLYYLYVYTLALFTHYGLSLPPITNYVFPPYYHLNPMRYYGIQGGLFYSYFHSLQSFPIVVNGINFPIPVLIYNAHAPPHIHALSDFTNFQSSIKKNINLPPFPVSNNYISDNQATHIGIPKIENNNPNIQGETNTNFKKHVNVNPMEYLESPKPHIPMYHSPYMPENGQKQKKEPNMDMSQDIILPSTLSLVNGIYSSRLPYLPSSEDYYSWSPSPQNSPGSYLPQPQVLPPLFENSYAYPPGLSQQMQEIPWLHSFPLPYHTSAEIPHHPAKVTNYHLPKMSQYQPFFKNPPTSSQTQVPYPYAHNMRVLTPGTDIYDRNALLRSFPEPVTSFDRQLNHLPTIYETPSSPLNQISSNQMDQRFGYESPVGDQSEIDNVKSPGSETHYPLYRSLNQPITTSSEEIPDDSQVIVGKQNLSRMRISLNTAAPGFPYKRAMEDVPNNQKYLRVPSNSPSLDPAQQRMNSYSSGPIDDIPLVPMESTCISGLRMLRDRALQQQYPLKRNSLYPLTERARRQVGTQDFVSSERDARTAHLRRDNSHRTNFVTIVSNALRDTSIS